MEINKLIGYTEIEVSEGVLPCKMGAYALQGFTESFGIELDKIMTTLVTREVKVDGKTEISVVPKEPIKFLATILMHGVNYASLSEGGKTYTIYDAFRWVDEIGFGSPTAISVYSKFIEAATTGVTPDSSPQVLQKKGQKKSRSRG